MLLQDLDENWEFIFGHPLMKMPLTVTGTVGNRLLQVGSKDLGDTSMGGSGRSLVGAGILGLGHLMGLVVLEDLIHLVVSSLLLPSVKIGTIWVANSVGNGHATEHFLVGGNLVSKV